MADSKQTEWLHWGDKDPYFGVLTGPATRKGTLDAEQKNKFFASGSRHVDYVLDRVGRHMPNTGRLKMLDYGCGVGRLVVPFADHFATVYGADISEGMLKEAGSVSQAKGLQNVVLTKTDGSSFPDIPTDLDLIHSFIVFQHIDPAHGLKVISNLLGLAKVGGGIAFHIIVARHTSVLHRVAAWLRKRSRPFHIIVNMFTGRPPLEPIMQMNTYSLNAVASLMAAKGFGPLIAERYGEYLTYETFFVYGVRER